MTKQKRVTKADKPVILGICALIILITGGAFKIVTIWNQMQGETGYSSRDISFHSDGETEQCRDKFPVLYQTDERWCHVRYGDSNLGTSGCAPTCMSMVVMGLTGNREATPDRLASYAEKNGYYIKGSGTSWDFMKKGGIPYGVSGQEICLDDSEMKSRLGNGDAIICSMRPGDFTDEGHFIVLTGVENGKYIIHDPNSRERTHQFWEYDTLSAQIKNLWVFQKLSQNPDIFP